MPVDLLQREAEALGVRAVPARGMKTASDALAVIERLCAKPVVSHELPPQQDETFGDRQSTTHDAEDQLVEIFARQGLDGFATGQHEIALPSPFTSTTPDVAWMDRHVAHYLDGLSKEIHGKVARARADELIRDALEDLGWKVLVMAASHLDDPELLRAGLRRIARALKRADVVDRITKASAAELRPAIGTEVAVLPVAQAQPYVHHVPLYKVRAAAGRFLENLEVEEEGWVAVGGPLDEQVFAIHVEGASMEPGIPDHAIAVFRAGVGGSRSGKVVLASLDDGTSTSHVVKRHRSEKRADDYGGWQYERITLGSDNPEHADLEVSPTDRISVIAEFVEVLQAMDVRPNRRQRLMDRMTPVDVPCDEHNAMA